MRTAAKRSMIVVVTAICLIGKMASVRAEDAAKPAEPAIAAPELKLAPDAAQAEDKWTFKAPLFLWFAGVNGTVSAKGRSVNVDASFSDILQHTDFGFQAYLELSKPRYGFYVQPTFMRLSNSGSVGPLKGDLSIDLWIVEIGAFYKFYVWEGDHHGSLAALAGGRYWSIHNEFTIGDSSGASFSGSSSSSLFDPIIGMRYEQYITKKLHAWVQGDIGGFDLSNSQSRFSWQVMPILGYDFMMPWIKKPSTVFAGYRVIDVQHYEGSGASAKSYHLALEGALIGLNVQFF